MIDLYVYNILVSCGFLKHLKITRTQYVKERTAQNGILCLKKKGVPAFAIHSFLSQEQYNYLYCSFSCCRLLAL